MTDGSSQYSTNGGRSDSDRVFFADSASATASLPPSAVRDFGPNGISDSSRATVLLPLRSRHQQALMPNGIWLSVRPSSVGNLDRHLPGSLLLLPVLGTCYRSPAPLPWSSGALNKPERRADDRSAVPIGSSIHPD
jgi:hypothetical protein